AVRVLEEQIRIRTEPPAPLFDEATGRLRSEEFTEAAWRILEHSAVRAADLGYERVLAPHCLLALLGETDGPAERLIRLQLPPDVGPARVTKAVTDAFRLTERAADRFPLSREHIGDAFVATLRTTSQTARLWGADRIDSAHLIAGLLDDPPRLLAAVLER